MARYRTGALIVTVLMLGLIGLLGFFYWEDILAEFSVFIENPVQHWWTGAAFFSLGVGGMIYFIVSIRKGWGAVPFMTFWFFITFVLLFLGLAMFTTAGLSAHERMVVNFQNAMDAGNTTEAVKVAVATLLLPIIFFLFAVGGFAVIAKTIADVDPTGATKMVVPETPLVTMGTKHSKKNYRSRKKQMSKKLGRK